MLGQLMGDFAASAGVILTELGLRLGLWDALAAGAATAETVAEPAGAARLPYVRAEWLSPRPGPRAGYDPAAGTFARRPGRGRRAGRGAAVGAAGGAAASFRGVVVGAGAVLRTRSGADGGSRGVRGRPAHAGGHGPDQPGGGRPRAGGRLAPRPRRAWPPGWPRARRGRCGLRLRGTGHRPGPRPGVGGHRLRCGRRLGGAGRGGAGRRCRDRVSFEVAAAADVPGGPYDLVTFAFPARPGRSGRALRRIRQVLNDDGVALLVEHAGSSIASRRTSARRGGFSTPRRRCPRAERARRAKHGSPSGRYRERRRCGGWRPRRVLPGWRRVEAAAPLNLLLELRPRPGLAGPTMWE